MLSCIVIITYSSTREDMLMSVNQDELMTIQEASQWASSYLNREVTASNISYFTIWKDKKDR